MSLAEFNLFQLFRRVAAALPGMEADKKPPEDSILFKSYSYLSILFLMNSDLLITTTFISACGFSIACLFPLCFELFIFLFYQFLNSFALVTEIDLNNAPVETKPAEGGCAC